MQRSLCVLRSVAFFVWMLISVVPWASAVVLVSIFIRGERVYWMCAGWLTMSISAARVICGVRHRMHGLDNLAAANVAPLVIVLPKHQSTWETIAVLTLFPDVAIITKKELLKVPIFGTFLRLSPMITIDRESGSRAIRKMNEEGALALSQGRSVLIFPEGTRSEPGAPVEFKRGVELLYGKLNCDLLPVAMNSGDFWCPGRQNKKAGTITLTCLPPIPAGENASAAIKAAEAAIQAELTSIRATAA